MNQCAPFRRLLVQIKSEVECTCSVDAKPPCWCLTAKRARSSQTQLAQANVPMFHMAHLYYSSLEHRVFFSSEQYINFKTSHSSQ